MTNGTDDEIHILKLSNVIYAMLCSTVLTNLSITSDSFLDTAVLSSLFSFHCFFRRWAFRICYYLIDKNVQILKQSLNIIKKYILISFVGTSFYFCVIRAQCLLPKVYQARETIQIIIVSILCVAEMAASWTGKQRAILDFDLTQHGISLHFVHAAPFKNPTTKTRKN